MIYLSRPSLWLPESELDNDDVIDRIHTRYRGSEAAWPMIANGVQLIFKACRSASRFKELDPATRIGTVAVRAARAALAEQDIDAEQIDLLIYGAISRDYVEPGTSMEIAAKLGIEQTRAMDVSNACVSQIMGIANAVAWMRMDDRIQTALISAAELGREATCFDIQSYEELPYLGAGATIGDGASAWLLSRAPFAGGCLRVVAADIVALPQHWQLSQTPLVGRFATQSSELLRVGGDAANALRGMLDRHGWTLDSVAQVLLHQPGWALHQKMRVDFGLNEGQAIFVHDTYGNVGSVGVSTAAHAWIEREPPQDGARVVLLATGAGLTGTVVLCEWVAG